jgi:hypothetical protein
MGGGREARLFAIAGYALTGRYAAAYQGGADRGMRPPRPEMNASAARLPVRDDRGARDEMRGPGGHMWVAGTHSFRLDDSVIKQKLAPGTIRRIIRFPADGARSTTGVRGDACRRPHSPGRLPQELPDHREDEVHRRSRRTGPPRRGTKAKP